MIIGNIEHINTAKIAPHPDNPRKDLGDLSELVESIKENGIMQNLTVVPKGETAADGYTVVIGHRRLAAAKAAGLDEVPCVISNMDYRKQIGTMLLENMQRSDLTIYEQAKGMQMMMDLGESAASISQLTGFSKTTVYHRLNIAKLDDKELQKAVSKQVTMDDLIKLEAIEDIEERNSVLKTVGSNSFDWNIRQAVDGQAWKKRRIEILQELSTCAKKITKAEKDNLNIVHHGYIATYNYRSWNVPKDIDELQYYYVVYDGDTSAIDVYKERVETTEEEEPVISEEQIAFDKAAGDAKEIIRLSRDRRRLFLIGLKYKEEHLETIAKYSVQSIVEHYGTFYGIECYLEYTLLKKDSIDDDITKNPIKHIALQLACSIEEDWNSRYIQIQNWGKRAINHTESESLDMLYEFLCALGYEMSEEEIAIQNGTHEIFTRLEDGS